MAKGKAKSVTEAPANEGASHHFPDWAEQAYRAYARGVRNWSALAREFEVDRETVKRQVLRFAEVAWSLRSEETLKAEQEYQVGLEEALNQAWIEHANADQSTAKVGALKLAVDCMEKLAAARGVVTKREGTHHSGEVSIDGNGRIDESAENTAAVLGLLIEAGALETQLDSLDQAAH